MPSRSGRAPVPPRCNALDKIWWVQASLETERQRFQQLFFPEGISFDGNGFVRTAVNRASLQLLCGKSRPEMKVWLARP